MKYVPFSLHARKNSLYRHFFVKTTTERERDFSEFYRGCKLCNLSSHQGEAPLWLETSLSCINSDAVVSVCNKVHRDAMCKVR